MAPQAATLIYLRDRSVEMLKKDLILKNPLRAWEPDTGRNAATPRLGLVVAPRGSGKTAVLVQFALDSLLRGNRVAHVSIGQSLEKTKEWYEDLFQELSRNYKLEHVGEVHSEIAANRLIMTFNTGSFSPAKLEERLKDLIEQDIFHPQVLVIDGFSFEDAGENQVRNLREHGLKEGASTRVLIYAGRLIKEGIAPRRACQVAVTWGITDDPQVQRSLEEVVTAIFP